MTSPTATAPNGTTIPAPPVDPPIIPITPVLTPVTLDQATQIGLAVHQQLARPNLGPHVPLGFSKTDAAKSDDAKALALATPFDYFVSVGLLTSAQAAALLQVLLGKASPDSLPPSSGTGPSVYGILRIAVLHGTASDTFDFWDVLEGLAEVAAGAALGFIAAGPAGAVAGGSLALVQVLEN